MKSVAVSFFIFAALAAGSAKADYLDRNGVLRRENGAVHSMTHFQALGVDAFGNQTRNGPACPGGTHLPSAREQAEFSRRRGAKGISNLRSNQKDCRPEFFYVVNAITPDGSAERFCFSEDGYYSPGSDFEYFFWSSSKNAIDARAAYGLNGDNGVVGLGYRDQYAAIRCVPN